MKFKFTLFLSSIILGLSLIFKIFPEEKRTFPTVLGLNAISCTPANFLLEDVDTTKQIAPLFENLGNLEYKISTNDPLAQKFFNQGLKLTYAFNHAEAHRSFMEAARLDPNCAMAYWGQAYALGPNINDTEPNDERKIKYNEALENALALKYNVSEKEQALIEALSHRYSTNLEEETGNLNLAYMKAMEDVANLYTTDENIQTLYAAAVMNTVPWNYWDKEGNPSPNIDKAKAALEKAIKLNPKHPGAHHYYIHMVELPEPDLAVPSADVLGSLMPAAGHIVHMPSHIYIRVGRYKDAVIANQKAILADEDYISQCYSQGLYPLGYYPHNIHFLWSASSLLGNSTIAIEAAKKTAEKVPVGEMKNLVFLQHFASTPLLAYTRFGKWNDILTYPKPNDDIKHLKLIWHYARGVAFTRKNNVKEAEEELSAIKTLINDPELEKLIAVGFDDSKMIGNIAYEIVAGEIEALKKNYSTSIHHFKKAIALEDDLRYNEPSEWHIPPRQNLGALLLQTQNYIEAEKIFKEDLKYLRQNGWSLMGLYKSLLAQKKYGEAAKIKQELDKSWKEADIEINTSIL